MLYRGLSAHGLSSRTIRLIVIALVLTVLHHTDHVLRVDHSGWPFKPQVTPFTFSLLAYPMIFFAWLGPLRLFWLRWALLAIGTGFTLFAHTMIESPRMQYAMWAHNASLEPADVGVHNLLNLHSTGLGTVAVIISMSLNIMAVASTVSMLFDRVGRRRGAWG